jgi:Tfp pilus assembly protein PilF
MAPRQAGGTIGELVMSVPSTLDSSGRRTPSEMGCDIWPPVRWWIAAAIVLAIAATPFLPAWGSPFHFDDLVAIKDNPEIAGSRVDADFASHARGGPLQGRPFAAWTFHLNWRVSGFDPQGFRTVNLLLHLLTALALGLVGRATLQAEAGSLVTSGWTVVDLASLAAMGLWAVHPLQTECVNYVTQRTEILATLCLALTLFGACWHEQFPGSPLPSVLMLGAATAGMASKELMVWAPIFVALGHRAWCAANWREAWQTRGRIWILLALSWLVLLLCNLGNPRGSTAGLSSKVAWWDYLAVQGWVWKQYAIQLVWPVSLVIDYGDWTHGQLILASSQQWTPGLALMGLACGLVLWRWFRNPREVVWLVAGLLWLGTTSSVIPIVTEIGADRRLSFPLFCILITLAHMVVRLPAGSAGKLSRYLLIPVALVGLFWSVLSAGISWQYQDPVQLWQRAVDLFPTNRRAHYNLGTSLLQQHPPPAPAAIRDRARRAFEEAVRLAPDDAASWHGLAGLALQSGDPARAIELAERALRAAPPTASLLYDYGNYLVEAGRLGDAIEPFRNAITQQPTSLPFRMNLAVCLHRLNRLPEAEAAYAEVLQLDPRQHDVRISRAAVFLQLGDRERARRELRQIPRNIPELAPRIRLVEQLLEQP